MSLQHDEQLATKEPAQKNIFPGTANYKKPAQKALNSSREINKNITSNGSSV